MNPEHGLICENCPTPTVTTKPYFCVRVLKTSGLLGYPIMAKPSSTDISFSGNSGTVVKSLLIWNKRKARF
jgi:hypothetical protein